MIPAALARQLAATVAARKLGLRDFVRRAMGHAWVPAPHLEPLYDALERCEREPVRAVVSMPPGHAKSESVLHALAWLGARTPGDLHGYVSYTAPATRVKSLRCRDIAEAAGVVPSPDVWSWAEWRNVCGGGLLASGIGGRMTGERITGTLVVDDPFKGPREAGSSTYRDMVSAWFDAVAYTRLIPGRSSCVVVHTRWERDDLIGRLLKVIGADGAAPWQEIRLPALDDAGRPLWPEVYPRAALDAIRAQLDARAISAATSPPSPSASAHHRVISADVVARCGGVACRNPWYSSAMGPTYP